MNTFYRTDTSQHGAVNFEVHFDGNKGGNSDQEWKYDAINLVVHYDGNKGEKNQNTSNNEEMESSSVAIGAIVTFLFVLFAFCICLCIKKNLSRHSRRRTPPQQPAQQITIHASGVFSITNNYTTPPPRYDDLEFSATISSTIVNDSSHEAFSLESPTPTTTEPPPPAYESLRFENRRNSNGTREEQTDSETTRDNSIETRQREGQNTIASSSEQNTISTITSSEQNSVATINSSEQDSISTITSSEQNSIATINSSEQNSIATIPSSEQNSAFLRSVEEQITNEQNDDQDTMSDTTERDDEESQTETQTCQTSNTATCIRSTSEADLVNHDFKDSTSGSVNTSYEPDDITYV